MQKTLTFRKKPTDYGGTLRSKRNGRGARPLTTANSLHLVLRSSKAIGRNSMTKGSRRQKITQIVYRHAARNGIHLISFANVGNHLHLHMQLMYRKTVEIKGQKKRLNHRGLYNRFIRGLTGAIALTMLTGALQANAASRGKTDRFWDQRPFTRYVATTRHFINMIDYLEVNRLEGQGFHRINARLEIAFRYDRKHPPDFDDI